MLFRSPTITDANLVLGRLGADRFLGGEMKLDPDAAERVIRERVAKPLGLDVPIVPAKGYSITLKGEGTRPSQALYMTESKIGVSGYEEGVRIAGVFELPGKDLRVDRRLHRRSALDHRGRPCRAPALACHDVDDTADRVRPV